MGAFMLLWAVLLLLVMSLLAPLLRKCLLGAKFPTITQIAGVPTSASIRADVPFRRNSPLNSPLSHPPGPRIYRGCKAEVEAVLDWLENQPESWVVTLTCEGDQFTVEVYHSKLGGS